MATRSSVIFFNCLRWVRRMIIFILLAIVVLIVAFEFYNPFAVNERAGLPNSTVTFSNKMFDDLPTDISIRFNNIGWIGNDFNDSIEGRRVFFIGSSTTQNIFITSPKNRWPDIAMAGLPYWYNNAALKGSGAAEWVNVVSSLAAYKPSHVVLLVTPYEPSDLKLTFTSSDGSLKKRFLKLGLIKYVVSPYYLTIRPANIGWGHKVDWEHVELDTLQLTKFDSVAAAESVLALANVVDKIKEIGAVPILISQPCPFGHYTYRGVLVDQMVRSQYEQAIHAYFNRKVSAICYSKGAYYIDGYSFKCSFDYYLDQVHFNVEGNKRFGAFVRDSLQTYIQRPY